jgi:hypothetical protein
MKALFAPASHNNSNVPPLPGKRSGVPLFAGAELKPPTALNQDTFQARKRPSFLTLDDQSLILRELRQCRYGVGWHWLNPVGKPYCRPTAEGVDIDRYHQSPRMGKMITGDCFHLASQLGYRLDKLIGKRYMVGVAQGNYVGSLWANHYFLMAWPREPDTAIHADLKRLRDGKITDGVLIIDPTFGVMGFSASELGGRQYSVECNDRHGAIVCKPEARKKTTCQSPYGNGGLTNQFPLGFVKQLAPGFLEKTDGIVCVGFQRKPAYEYPLLVVSLMTADNRKIPVDNWQRSVPQGTPLYRILTRIEKNLKDPKAQRRKPIGVMSLAKSRFRTG